MISLFPTFVQRNEGYGRFTVSEPSRNAALVLLRQFRFVKSQEGTIEPTEKKLALIIDCCTQVFRFSRFMDQVDHGLPWQNREELSRNIRSLQHALKSIEEIRNRLPGYCYGNQQPKLEGKYQISAPAWHTAGTLFYQFTLEEIGTIEATKANVAILVDVNTQIFRIQNLLDEVVKVGTWYDPGELRSNLTDVRDAMRAMDIARERLPNHGMPLEFTKVDREEIERHIADAQMGSLREVTNHLVKQNWSAENQRRVLRQAGLVR